MRPPRALPAAHFDRNERHAYLGDRTLKIWRRKKALKQALSACFKSTLRPLK
jgi:hypothetical protein